jgi:hypothetical protein
MVLLGSDCSGDVFFLAKVEFIIVVGVVYFRVCFVVVVLVLFRL